MDKYKSVTLRKFVKSEADDSRVQKTIDDSIPWFTCVHQTIGTYYTLEEAEQALAQLPYENNVVGYLIEGPEAWDDLAREKFMEFDPYGDVDEEANEGRYDESPLFAISYHADKSINARYSFGEHRPGQSRYLTEPCQFKTGDMVWVLQPGYGVGIGDLSAMYPAIFVKPLDLQYITAYYEAWFEEYKERNKEFNPNPSNEFKARKIESKIKGLLETEWDSLVVQPLVILNTIDGHIGNEEEEYIERYMIFPYIKNDCHYGL